MVCLLVLRLEIRKATAYGGDVSASRPLRSYKHFLCNLMRCILSQKMKYDGWTGQPTIAFFRSRVVSFDVYHHIAIDLYCSTAFGGV